MTQIINEKLKKCCNQCNKYMDSPCAWLSLGNEYCDEIMEVNEEIERLNKEILGLNNCIIEFHSEFCNKQAEINRLNNIIKTKEEGFMAVVDELCETTEALEETKKAIDEIERYFKEDYYYCNHPKMIYRNDLFKKIKYLKRKLKKN